MKRAFKMKQKTLFIIFNGISLKQIKQIFLEGESPNLSSFQHICLRRRHYMLSSETCQDLLSSDNLQTSNKTSLVLLLKIQ